MGGYAVQSRSSPAEAAIQIFLCGDVMLGRGIDQVLPPLCGPELYESYAGLALDYVRLAEHGTDRSPPVDLPYIWEQRFEEFDCRQPDARIINLETSIMHSSDFVGKHQLPYESRECRVSGERGHRLLRARRVERTCGGNRAPSVGSGDALRCPQQPAEIILVANECRVERPLVFIRRTCNAQCSATLTRLKICGAPSSDWSAGSTLGNCSCIPIPR